MISKSLTSRIFPTIQQFTIQKYTQPLGVGSFGTVRLGLHKYTNKTYAIKIKKICVDDSFKDNQLCLLQRQISIQYNLNHPHIVKLWDVIEDSNKIYLIMEYAPKGNLFNLQSRNKGFSQLQTFKLFMQTLDAIDYLHRNNIFHRDIKPQNILLDHQMNVKLCDFGWAAPDINRKRSTFCGTYEYMAPEMINEQQYDYRIDIWALGVLLYELIHATAPFPAETFDEMRKKISSGSYEINVNISAELKNLIMSILQFEPKQRPSIQQIKANQWMEKMKKLINVQKIQQKVQKKKGKNVYGSLDFAPSSSKHPSTSKFSSVLFQDSTNNNKKQSKIIIPCTQLKKKMKKKCKTLEQQSMQKLARPCPLKNLLTLHTEKQNQCQKQQFFTNQLTKPLLIKDNKYKMLTKVTENNLQLPHKESKICFGGNNTRMNNYFGDVMEVGLKNFKSQDRVQKNQKVSSRLQTADVKKKKKKVA